MITKKELLAKFEQTFGKAPVKPDCYCESCELAEYKVDAARYRGLKKIFMYEFNVPIGSFERIANSAIENDIIENYIKNNIDDYRLERAMKIAKAAHDSGADIVAGVRGGSWYVTGYANHTFEVTAVLMTDDGQLVGRETHKPAMCKALGSKKLRGYYGY